MKRLDEAPQLLAAYSFLRINLTLSDCRKVGPASESAEADEEFVVTEEGTEEDDEQTLEEEEMMEEESDQKNEIDNLQKEGMHTMYFLAAVVHLTWPFAHSLRFIPLPLGIALYGPDKQLL